MTLHLSIPLWLPAVAGVLGAFLPGRLARTLGVVAALLTLAYAIVIVADFDGGAAGLQYVTNESWIRELGISYKLGIDGLNLFLVLLTTILFFASALWASRMTWAREPQFWLHFGLGQTAVLGALMAQDLALFVAFFDLMLIPFFFLTGMYGGPDRVAAVTKLVIYTLVGSLLMLSAAIALAVLSDQANDAAGLSFAFSDLAKVKLSDGQQNWIFLCFAAAFLVKMPAFPLHGWMPDGYRNMPLPALAVFSGVLSKVAAYGFLRIATPLLPDATVHFQDLLLVIALASILYGSAMAFTTTEARLILGYSSVAQLGFILLGIFALRDPGAQGAVLQAFNHGLVVAPAFFIVWLLALRTGGSEDVRDMGGLAFRAPVLATLFLIVALANLAMPGTSNFAGEFLILLGAFQSKMVFAIVASVGVALASVYTLRLFIRTMHNRVGAVAESRELRVADGVVLVPLVLAILALALYPQLPLSKGEKAVIGSVAIARDIQDPPAPKAAATPAPAAAGAPGATGGAPAGSGQVQLDPSTGQPIDPTTGQPVPVDPNAGAAPAPEQEVPTP